jgi:hypothetical protein
MSNDLENKKQQVFNYCRTLLGDGMIDVELDPNHYEVALEKALGKYRQRAENAVEESYAILELQEDTNDYILPNEVIEVRELFRRSIGSRTGGGDGGTLFEPFNLAYTNTYLLSSTQMGGLSTYYAFAGYQELVGRMFGSFIAFKFEPVSKKLTIMQRPRGDEQILMQIYNQRPDFSLLSDPYAGQWLKDYTLAVSKYMLGEARSKFATISTPQGGTSLNGDALKADATAEMEKLEMDLANYVDGSKPLSFVIG